MACLLVADVVGIKLFQIRLLGLTVEHTCGMLTFPVTFMLTDLLNDYYGKAAARRVTFIGFAMAGFMFGVINLALAMPVLRRLRSDVHRPSTSTRCSPTPG